MKLRNTWARTTMTLFLALLCTDGAWADNVTAEQAHKLAQAFLNNHLTNTSKARRAPGTMPQLTLENQVSGLYVFNVSDDGGFIIVSNDDATTPILGYSDSGSFDSNNMPDNLKAWLQGYADEIAWLQQHESTATTAPNKAPRRVGTHSITTIGPLLTTTWDQGSPYNASCPPDNNDKKYVTGCVATAMAQIMKYHQWPQEAAQPISSYNLPSKTFDWANMKNSYTENYTDAQKTAVADLMLYCGRSVNMDYGFSSSGAITRDVVSALTTYFGYSTTTKYVSRSYYSYANWTDLIYHELSQGRPVLYGGQSTTNGHAFVCDGYKYESNTDLFHINWGWGGRSDGFFVLSVLNPKQQGIGGNPTSSAYNSGQEAIVGIQKTGGTGTVLDVHTNIVSLTANSITVSPATIALGESADVTINVTNNSSDAYDGELCLLVNDKLSVGKMFEIPANTTQNCIITYTPAAVGTYTLEVAVPNSIGSYTYPYRANTFTPATLTVDEQTSIDLSPTDLTATNLTAGTATIGWTDVGNVTQWNLQHRTTNSTTEDFNNGVMWQNLNWGGASTWEWAFGGGIKGSACYKSIGYSNDSNSNHKVGLLSPEYSIGSAFSFYAWGEGEVFYVGVKIGSGNTQSISGNIVATSTQTLYTFDLSKYTGQTGRIVIIHCNSGQNSYSDLFIDNVTFIGSSSDWTTVNNVTTKPYRLTGLTKQTTYEVQVQPVINNGGKWSESVFFTTTDNAIELANGTPNTDLISKWDGVTANVTLADRFLYKDGNWNTLCLPFDVTIADSPLAGTGVEAKTLTSASLTGGTLTLMFGNAVTELKAGVPYIIKWNNDATNPTISNPVFQNVIVKDELNPVEQTGITFVATYAPVEIGDDGDNTILYLGANNKLYWPNTEMTIGTQRAYFKLTGNHNQANIRTFSINFGDEPEETAIVSLSQEDWNQGRADSWYSLDGRRLNSKPTVKGLYIHNGKKVAIP